jgi:hypothetical protein
MQNQSKGHQKLAETFLGISQVIEQARAAKSKGEADRLMQNAAGRAMAMARLHSDYAEAISESDNHQTVKH